MTAICSGGTSSAKPGVAPLTYVGSSAAEALLNNVPTVWAVPLAAFLGLLTYEATTFCTTDPPADPGLTAADAEQIIGNIATPYLAAPALAKLAQLVSRYMWYQLCQCDSVATPAPPAPPSEPTGWPDFNPPSLPQTTASPCAVWENTRTTPFQPATSTFEMIGTGGRATAAGAVPITPGTTSIRATFGVSGLGAGNLVALYITGYDASGTLILANHVNFTTNTEVVNTYAVSSSVVSIKSVEDINGSGTPTTGDIHVKFEAFCNNQTPSTPAAPCCPPDPSLAAQIQQILGYVTLIQRQIAPFAFVDGPQHTSLSGDGSITVTDPIIGVRVECTTIPASYGVSDGTPLAHFELGFVSLGDADGWFGSRPLRTSELTWQPRWSGAATRIGYTLSPGVIATITELRRES